MRSILLVATALAGVTLLFGLSAALAGNPTRRQTIASSQARAAHLITEGSAGPARIGMTVAQARRASPGLMLRRTSDGEGIALIAVMRGKETTTTSNAPSDATGRAGEGSLCDSGEKVVFSAFTESSGKIVSICSSSRLDSGAGYLQYRFGRPGRVELHFPESKQNSQRAFDYTRYTRPLVTYLTLTFKTRDYEYSIHDDHDAEQKPASRAVYMTVVPLSGAAAGSKEVTIKLRSPMRGSLMSLENVVPNKPWSR